MTGPQQTREQVEALVIGGGPAGATTAALLAEAGIQTVVVEQAQFPRFQIGESLLPATVRILERLGLADEVDRRYLKKPGGKWLYGTKALVGDFSQPDRRATFHAQPHAYMVERSTFDQLLLDRAEALGADVRCGMTVTEVRQAEGRVCGVQLRDEEGRVSTLDAAMTFDCSGSGALVAASLGLRRPTVRGRLGVYAHYAARAREPDVADGWFVGQMIHDGWVWLIPLDEERISVGVVLGSEERKRYGHSPEELLDGLVAHNPLLRECLGERPRRLGPVRATGRLGHTSERFWGPGWVAVGDAAFFVDPCYSTGVHLAMLSAERAAEAFLESRTSASDMPADFSAYERDLRVHEARVTRLVDAFYIATRSPPVQHAIVQAQNRLTASWFVTIVGGDFDRNGWFISLLYGASRMIDRATAWLRRRAPAPALPPKSP